MFSSVSAKIVLKPRTCIIPISRQLTKLVTLSSFIRTPLGHQLFLPECISRLDFMESRDMDEIYRTVPIEEIPWVHDGPTPALVDFVEGGAVSPCKAIDLGCGTGTNTIYLAEQGFEVTGADISRKAIEIAQTNAKAKGVECRFIAADILGNVGEVVGDRFEFALAWQVLHHIFPEKRGIFVRNVHGLLNDGARFLSVCFSENNRNFGGVGKVRRSSLGTVLYFSSEEELRELFSPYFRIIELKTIEIPGKPEPHAVNFVFMEKH